MAGFPFFSLIAIFFTLCRMTSNGAFYGSFVLFDDTAHNSTIAACNGMLLDLLRDIHMCRIVFADDQCTGRVHIDSVYDSRTDLSVDSGEYCLHNDT